MVKPVQLDKSLHDKITQDKYKYEVRTYNDLIYLYYNVFHKYVKANNKETINQELTKQGIKYPEKEDKK